MDVENRLAAHRFDVARNLVEMHVSGVARCLDGVGASLVPRDGVEGRLLRGLIRDLGGRIRKAERLAPAVCAVSRKVPAELVPKL